VDKLNQAGWGTSIHSGRQHYFDTAARSLCRRVQYLGPRADGPINAEPGTAMQVCVDCQRKATKQPPTGPTPTGAGEG
jgi:hypothetical protein